MADIPEGRALEAGGPPPRAAAPAARAAKTPARRARARTVPPEDTGAAPAPKTPARREGSVAVRRSSRLHKE